MSVRSARRPRVLAVLALAVVFSLFGVTGVAGAAAPEFRGVQLHSLWSDSSERDMDRELDLARDAHANVVRVDVVWGSLETGGKGQYSPWYLNKLDRFVAEANARGMKVIATLWSSPCWASSAPESVKQGCDGAWWDRNVGAYPPRDANDYGDAAKFITSRYGSRLAALEVWNEPNLETSDHFWKTSDKAGAYARLLKAAYPKAKAGDAAVPVLAGSIAFADRPFLDELYAHGIKGFHDGISVHPYNEARHPADRWKDEWKKYTLLPGIEWMRQGQQAAGDLKPLWVTEFGWTTGSATAWEVSEAKQAEFVRDSFPLLGNYSYLKGAVIYNLREKGNDPVSHEDNFGLVNRDFTPKPAYTALREGIDAATAGTAVPKPRVTLRVRRRGTLSIAYGLAPRSSRIQLSLSGCKRLKGRRMTVRVSRGGRFRRRLGASRRLSGCKVTARLRGSRPEAASARVGGAKSPRRRSGSGTRAPGARPA